MTKQHFDVKSAITVSAGKIWRIWAFRMGNLEMNRKSGGQRLHKNWWRSEELMTPLIYVCIDVQKHQTQNGKSRRNSSCIKQQLCPCHAFLRPNISKLLGESWEVSMVIQSAPQKQAATAIFQHMTLWLTNFQDDAAEASWFDICTLPALAFDHSLVVRSALRMLAASPEGKDRTGV